MTASSSSSFSFSSSNQPPTPRTRTSTRTRHRGFVLLLKISLLIVADPLPNRSGCPYAQSVTCHRLKAGFERGVRPAPVPLWRLRYKTMKIIDIPQTGKLGLTVSFQSRNGLVRRTLVIPRNPNTLAQLEVRSNFTADSQAFDALTEQQQDTWNVAAAAHQSRPTLGQSGPLTGLQLFQKINATLRLLGLEPVDVPPSNPVFPDNPVGALAITNVDDVVALKLACPGTPPANTIVRATAPQRSGVRSSKAFRVLGVCPAPAQGSCDITNLYVARFGVPPVGSRVFVSTNVTLDGWQAPRLVTSGLVPASS